MKQLNRIARPHDGAPAEVGADRISNQLDKVTCDKVLKEIARANELGVTITIWDLPQGTGLALHDAFATVRSLEYARMVRIGDNPSDPFGATLHLEDNARNLIGNPPSK